MSDQSKKLRIALVCASNQNRSMETHALLIKKGYQNVSSYGTNGKVRLPGPAPDQPLIYEFGTSYASIIEDLRSRDEELYVHQPHFSQTRSSLFTFQIYSKGTVSYAEKKLVSQKRTRAISRY
jgi:hypothetical protein